MPEKEPKEKREGKRERKGERKGERERERERGVASEGGVNQLISFSFRRVSSHLNDLCRRFRFSFLFQLFEVAPRHTRRHSRTKGNK